MKGREINRKLEVKGELSDMNKTRVKIAVGLVAVACIVVIAGVCVRVCGGRTHLSTPTTESARIEVANSDCVETNNVHIRKEELPFYKNEAGDTWQRIKSLEKHG